MRPIRKTRPDSAYWTRTLISQFPPPPPPRLQPCCSLSLQGTLINIWPKRTIYLCVPTEPRT